MIKRNLKIRLGSRQMHLKYKTQATPKTSFATPNPQLEKLTINKVASVPPQVNLNIFNLEVRQIDMNLIVIDEKRPTFNTDRLSHIAESMGEIGLGTPITVREKNGRYELITGNYRHGGAKLLGWSVIDCFIFKGDERDARIWSLTENLFRKDLPVLERAELINQWIGLVDEKRQEAGQVAHPGASNPMIGGSAPQRAI